MAEAAVGGWARPLRPPPCGHGSSGTRGADHARREHDPGERKHPGEQVEAALRRRGENALAELVDELVLDLRLGVPGRDARADEGAHALGDRRGRRGERLVAGRADELALELLVASGFVRSPPPARPRRARRRARRGASASCRLAERDLDVALEVFLGERAGDVLADDPPLRVDEPRLRESRHAVVPECRAVLVADDRDT